MRHRSTQQLSFGDGFIDPSLFALNDELKEVDKLMSDASLLQPFEAIFSPTMGRPGTAVDVYLRMMYLKFRWGLAYEEVEQEVRERIPWRFFCHLSLDDTVPDATTLIKLNQRFGEKRIEAMNRRLVKHISKENKLTVRKIRIDTTTIEANITYPTDVKLLHQVVKTVTRTVQRAGGKITSHVRATKKAIARLGQSLKSKSKDRNKQAQKTLKRVTRYAHDTVTKAKAVLEQIKTTATQARVVGVLEEQLHLADRILTQTGQKLHGATAIPERIVSFYDPHARPIRKGKLGKENEFGRTLALVQDASGVFVHYKIHHGNPSDKTLAVPLVKTVNKTFHTTVQAAALDKGFYSAENLAKLHKLGVHQAAIPKVGRLNPSEKRRQQARWFRRMYKFRCGIEAGISMLKRCFSLNRIRGSGDSGTAIWVGFALFSYNLWQRT